VEAQLDVVQERREQVLQQLGLQHLELLERQDELLELALLLALQLQAGPRWHRRNRQRL
jgi:hypothetical protein